MSMSAHVTMRRQDRQEETTEEPLDNSQKHIVRSRVHRQRRLTANAVTNQPDELKAREIVVIHET